MIVWNQFIYGIARILTMKYQHKITSDIIKDIPVISIEGDLTSDADGDAKGVYTEVKDRYSPQKLIVNFENTKYINSSGIATLIHIIQDVNEKGGIIAFVGMSDHLKKVMSIVGISDFVQIYNSNNEALNSL
jgi:anti-anti-sigma factor